jgi:hypothetical protein
MINKNFEDIRGFFTRDFVKISDKLFEAASKELIADGIVEVRKMANGTLLYRLTPMGLQIGKNVNSNPKDRH